MKLTDEMRAAIVAANAQPVDHAQAWARSQAIFVAGYRMGQQAMRERAAKLREALRKHAIGHAYATDEAAERDDPSRGYCLQCNRNWRMPGDERHAPGCLAAEQGEAK